jgi:hypothetical protein
MKVSFHVHFTKNGFISHFMPIPVKYETNDHFRPGLPMKYPQKGMKREGLEPKVPISRKTGLVSPHFTLRFTSFSTQQAGRKDFHSTLQAVYCQPDLDAEECRPRRCTRVVRILWRA